jgi:hypothetical protein
LFLATTAVVRGWTADTVVAWISGTGTLLAFGAALLLYRREADRDQQRDVDQRRAQAEKVAAWYGPEDPQPGKRAFALVPARDLRDLRILIRNASDLPIFNVTPLAYLAADTSRTDPLPTGYTADTIRYHRHLDPRRGRFTLTVLPPQSTIALAVEAPDGAVSPVVDLMFRDNANRWWTSKGGALTSQPFR